jgi:hypothetical protein
LKTNRRNMKIYLLVYGGGSLNETGSKHPFIAGSL